MTGPTILAIGLFFLAVGAARYFVARPERGKEQTAFDRGDYIGSKVVLAAGILLVVVGAIVTVVELLT